MPFTTDLVTREWAGHTWKLVHALKYQGQEDTFTIPAGFVTDYATVPDALCWLINKTGPGYTKAAVLHDWLLTELAAGADPEHGDVPPANSRDADGLFRRVMREEGVPFMRRWLMWTAVRWASLFNKRRAYGRNLLADLPRMLPFTLVALAGPLEIAALCWLYRFLTSPLR